MENVYFIETINYRNFDFGCSWWPDRERGRGVEKMRAKTRSQSADVDKIAGIEKIRVETTGNIGLDSDI